MSSRERWTVYPLLFMTLGIALTGRYKLTTKEIVCEKLICTEVDCKAMRVIDREGHEQVAVFSNAAGGQVRTQGTQTKIRSQLGGTDRMSGLMLFDGEGRVLRGSSLSIVTPPRVAEPPAEEPEVSTPEQAPPAEEPKPAEQKPAENQPTDSEPTEPKPDQP